ncbi:MAG: aldo/keto reductase [Chitinophagaceae bacterium]|nr:aldo/keto reductase [Chitinophagaceae bacterium]
MIQRKLGQSDLMLSPLVLGGNVFGWTVSKEAAFDILDEFTDHGFNAIDTANSYSKWAEGNNGGESETIIGEWLRKSGKRKKVLLFTKVGDETPDGKGLSQAQITLQIELSLKRLQTDHVDVYFSHRDDHITPVEETLTAYDKLISQGKVRYIGISNFTSTRMRESLNVALHKNLPQYIALQPRYNICDRNYEGECKTYAVKYGMGVVTYQSLAGGFLTGKYKNEADLTKSARGKSVANYLRDKLHIIDKLEKLAGDSGYPASALSLAWVLQHDTITAPIASATSVIQLEELMRIAEPEILHLPLKEVFAEN